VAENARPRGGWRKALPWALLAVVVVGALAFAVLRGTGTSSPEDRTRAVASQLRCLECQGLSVADSRTTTAVAIKVDIRRRIDAGESDREIKQAYVDRYGEYILLEPAGSNRVLWLLPVAIVLVGGGVIVFVVLRNARRPKFYATDDDRAVVAAARGDHDEDQA
jgi:cytochrome c-type biogenesis protein CcmH